MWSDDYHGSKLFLGKQIFMLIEERQSLSYNQNTRKRKKGHSVECSMSLIPKKWNNHW